jgi:poly(3-hydroxybutyrate) depolymerase
MVSEGSGKAVDKAVVELVKQGLKDTTGPDGGFALTRAGSPVRRGPASGAISMDRGVLRIDLADPGPLAVEVFDLKGNQLRMEALPAAGIGTYRWDFGAHALSAQPMLIKVRSGREVRTFRYLPARAGAAENGIGPSFTPASPYLAKVAAAVDTLKITAPGYPEKRIALGTLDTSVNVALASAGGEGRSAGCGKTPSLKTGKALSFTYSGGQARTYNLDVPADYDNTHAYRLVVSIHWLSGTANDVTNGNNWATFKPYYGLMDLANPKGGNSTTIFVAPQGLGNSWPSGNVPFITALVQKLKDEFCIDTTRIFAEGFSMGGSMSYALACEAPDVFRAVAVHSGGPMSGCNKKNKPVAYFMTHGTADSTCTFPAFGVPQVNEFAKLNGCQAMDIPGTLVPTDRSGMNPKCADFQGCSDGHPTRACIFVGPHTPSPGGANTWVPGETWKFISQF